MRSIAAILVVLAVALAFAGCGSKPGDLPEAAAVVNGKDISSSDYVRQLNLQAGGQVLMVMIQQAILMDWAEEAGVPPTDAQIKDQVEMQKEEGLWEDQVKMFGEAGLDYKMRGDQARINLAKKFIKTADKELEAVYEQNKVRFVHGPRKRVAVIINNEEAKVKDAAKAMKGGKSFEDANKEFSLQSNLKIWVADEDDSGRIPPDIVQAVKDLDVGKVSDVVSFEMQEGQKTYVILKVLSKQGAADKKFKEVRDDILDTVVLQKSMTDEGFLKKLSKRVKDAKIQVNIEQYKDLPKQIESMSENM